MSDKSMAAGELVAQFNKDYGDNTASMGGHLVDMERVPTGILPFDLATGGGFPRGRCSIVYGPESSNKTNMALKAIAMHQKIWPDLTCAFIDMEGSFDPQWATLLGVDCDKLVVLRPDFAEQTVDMVESLLYATDIGLVVIDSLAAMMTTGEADNSAEKAVVGGNALVVGKLSRKSTLAMRVAYKEWRKPTLIYINQTRFKIGVMFGDPETQPGGNAPKFQASMIARVYGKNIMDSKVSQIMPAFKEVKFVLKKWKVPVVAASGQYSMVTMPHKGFGVGDVNDWNTVSHYLKDFGQMEKAGTKGWTVLGDSYATIAEFQDKMREDAKFGIDVRQFVMQKVLETTNLLQESV